ncbi:unnamed protein product, partial [Closterium sp. NIES-65]
TTQVLEYSDAADSRFYGVYGSALNAKVWGVCAEARGQGHMPTLEMLRMLAAHDTAVDVVLVDFEEDNGLRKLVARLAAGRGKQQGQHGQGEGDAGVRAGEPTAGDVARVVAEAMGGPVPNDEEIYEVWEELARESRVRAGSPIMLIGSIKLGLSRHRALLFKALADYFGIPCRMIRGTNGEALIATRCRHNREWLVDVMRHPGQMASRSHDGTVAGPAFLRSPLQFDLPSPWSASPAQSARLHLHSRPPRPSAQQHGGGGGGEGAGAKGEAAGAGGGPGASGDGRGGSGGGGAEGGGGGGAAGAGIESEPSVYALATQQRFAGRSSCGCGIRRGVWGQGGASGGRGSAGGAERRSGRLSTLGEAGGGGGGAGGEVGGSVGQGDISPAGGAGGAERSGGGGGAGASGGMAEGGGSSGGMLGRWLKSPAGSERVFWGGAGGEGAWAQGAGGAGGEGGGGGRGARGKGGIMEGWGVVAPGKGGKGRKGKGGEKGTGRTKGGRKGGRGREAEEERGADERGGAGGAGGAGGGGGWAGDG